MSSMFIGHFAAALGAKRLAPAVSLGALFLAAQLADLLWPTLVLLGVERFTIDPGNTVLTPLDFEWYPYSHSLVGLSLWGLLFAGAYRLTRRLGPRAVAVIVALVVSHWLLDVLVHRADMPLGFGAETRVGLGLWNHPLSAVALEATLFGMGVGLYLRATRPVDRRGSIGVWALVAFLALVYAANLLGPPPPSTAAVTWSAQAMWLLVLWGYWIDRHRVVRSARPASRA